GSAWQEKFSRGARKRRNSSADDVRGHAHHRRVSEDIPGFDAILNVDEVDKRRRSRDASESPAVTPRAEDPHAHIPDATSGSGSGSDAGLLPSLTRQKLRISTTTPLDSGSGASGKTATPSRTTTLKEEDEEDQLFPLPSPRRTPNGSPLPSPLPTPSSSTTNLATFGQKSSSQTNLAAGASPGLLNSSGSGEPRPTYLQVPSTPPPPPPPRPMDTIPETRGYFTEEPEPDYAELSLLQEADADEAEVDDVPELTRSPSLFSTSTSPSPNLSLSTPSPSPVIPRHTLARREMELERTPPPPYSASPSPAVAIPHSRESGRESVSGGRDRSSSLSVSTSPSSWRKLQVHLNAGSLLKAGAEVLKGVNGMGGSVVV
ncbi:hypothetical protein EIP91_008407, partial [Steccherinum ochraceum]